MTSINNKKFSSLSENLERMADGAEHHLSDEGFPSQIVPDNLRTAKRQLQDAREEYELQENAARIEYDKYNELLEDLENKYRNYSTQLYGVYGKRNQVVADFGLKPHKVTGKKGSRKQDD